MPGGCFNGTALRDSVLVLKGVRGSSCASGSALAGGRFSMPVSTQEGITINLRAAPVDASFFEVLGVRPVAGRLLDAKHGEDTVLIRPDAVRATPAMDGSGSANPAVVINESAARALGYANPQDAVNQYRRWARMLFSAGEITMLDEQASKIVGVVPDFTLGSIREAIEPTGYYIDPRMQFTLLVRLDGATIPETMPAIEAQWKKWSDGRPFRGQFLSQVLNDLYADIRRQASLFSVFSAVAVIVASLGLLGLAVYTAERRTREIGVRKAMGASRNDILRFISWQFARPVLIANVISWPVAWLFMQRWLEGFAYHVELGLLAFLLASALALIIALATVAGHAILVSRARPVEALRYE
jgi:putative ABC transport system permease protein